MEIFNMSNYLWVEKYRPKLIDDLILPENYKNKFSEFIQNKEIPHILLIGPAGCGKTSLARILTSNNGILSSHDNVLMANGSSKSARSINFVDDIIEPFLKIPPYGKDKIRVVYIDECDRLTPESFGSQRGIIEKYESNGRFLWTANYISMIPPEILSRFQIFKFSQMPINYVTDYCLYILNNEKIKFKNEDVNFLIKEFYPDIRKIINKLESNIIGGVLKLNSDTTMTFEKKIINNIVEIISATKNKEKDKINKIISTLVESLDTIDLDYRSLYHSLFYNKLIPVPVKIIINTYTNSHNRCLVPSMHFMSMIFEIIKCSNGG